MTLAATITIARGSLVAECNSAEALDAVKKWPGWARNLRANTWQARAPLNPSAVLAANASKVVTQEWCGEALDLLRETLATRALVERALANKQPTLRIEGNPMPHQANAVEAIELLGFRALLADEMGLGKSRVALWSWARSGDLRLLIVCPVTIKWNWRNEILAAIGIEPIVIHGTRKQRVEQLAALRVVAFDDADAPRALHDKRIAIINYDLLASLDETQAEQLQAFVEGQFLVADESHYVKNRLAERTEETAKLSEQAAHVLLLTGTPIRNTIEDLYSQVELIRPRTWTSFTDFENRHIQRRTIVAGNREARVFAKAKNVDELASVMQTIQIARKKGEVLNLPPKIHTYPILELDKPTRTLYTAMREHARFEISNVMAELGQQTLIWDPRAKSAMEAFLRCEQMAQGFVGGVPEPLADQVRAVLMKSGHAISGRQSEFMIPGSQKIVWLLETVESIRVQGGAPVIFTRFNGPGFWLSSVIENSAFLYGGADPALRAQRIAEFQDRKIDVLICQVRIAEGFNLTRSQDVLFLGRDWSPAVNSQAEDRCHRIGQAGTVNIQVPIVADTVELQVHKKLIDKASDADQALRKMTLEEMWASL